MTTATYSLYAMGATTKRQSMKGGSVMGINDRLRYGVSWIIIRCISNPMSWLVAGVTLLQLGVTMFALWFSPELQRRETIRILKKISENVSEDD